MEKSEELEYGYSNESVKLADGSYRPLPNLDGVLWHSDLETASDEMDNDPRWRDDLFLISRPKPPAGGQKLELEDTSILTRTLRSAYSANCGEIHVEPRSVLRVTHHTVITDGVRSSTVRTDSVGSTAAAVGIFIELKEASLDSQLTFENDEAFFTSSTEDGIRYRAMVKRADGASLLPFTRATIRIISAD